MLKCEDISIKNKNNITLIDKLNFFIKESEIFTLTGPSGVGKSTLLKYICGIRESNFFYSGRILIDNNIINEVPTNLRRVGMIFQNDLLFPHMNVIENILFATPSHKKKNFEDAANLLNQLNLEYLSTKKINTLSGGEYSRVCLARIMMNEPKVLLVDEPFSNLDKKTKALTRDFFYNTISNLNCATLIVTHDLEDIYSHDKIIKL